MAAHLQRCHVIEGMVQLLTNGLVLELLSIQLIWRSKVTKKYRQVSRTAATHRTHKTKSRAKMDRGKEQREKSRRQKIGQPF